MCGIAGWYARRGFSVARDVVARQCDRIIHRGPDDEGLLIDGDFGFGMRRLSIIDVAGGHQPISTSDGCLSIVFNGEIYNFRELREQLSELGHRFRTGSDTETVLAAYREWGDAAWACLDGMFAVAIWDSRTRQLTLARDPLGIKPLYVTEQNGGIAFGSELKSLMDLPDHRFDTSPRGVHDFFSYGHVRPDRTIYSQVRMLAPGHALTIGPRGPAAEHRFWRPRFHAAPARSEGEWIEEFRLQWLRTVEHHMIADVEVGAFLSGGVDSSAVVAAMARIAERPIKTFTIGFPIARYDESPIAEAVARHLGCDHHTRVIDLADARDILPQLQRCYDEPFADPSAVPTWYLSRLAREHVKAVLSGDGGDEVFMGYKRHLTERKLAQLPPSLRRAAQGVAALPITPSRKLNRVIQRWQKAVGTAALPDGMCRFFAKTQITSRALRARVLAPELVAAYDGEGAFERLRDEYFPDLRTLATSDLEQFVYGDLTLNLPAAMLTKVDRASMAHSLEVRVPLLSPAFVDWAMGVPTDMKIRDGVGKHIVRQAISPWLPEGILDRRKQGFQIPLAEWFEGDFGGHARELWHDSGAASLGFLDKGAVEEMFKEHRAGRRDHGRFLYALSMFSLWSADRRASGVPASSTPVVLRPAQALPPPVPGPAASPIPANDTGPAHARKPRKRFYALAAALAAGWLLHDAAGPLSQPVRASSFVDEAVRSHRATLIRAAMRSQPEIVDYDRSEIAAATGITMPKMPSRWHILDVQVYPSDTGPSVEVAVENEQGEAFSVFAMRADTPGGERPIATARHPDQVVYWDNGNLAYALVGAVSAKRLLQLASMLDDGRAVPTGGARAGPS